MKGLEPRVFINRGKETDSFIKRISESISPNETKIIKGLKLFESNKISDISHKINIKSINEYFRRLVDKGILKPEKLLTFNYKYSKLPKLLIGITEEI